MWTGAPPEAGGPARLLSQARWEAMTASSPHMVWGADVCTDTHQTYKHEDKKKVIKNKHNVLQINEGASFCNECFGQASL